MPRRAVHFDIRERESDVPMTPFASVGTSSPCATTPIRIPWHGTTHVEEARTYSTDYVRDAYDHATSCLELLGGWCKQRDDRLQLRVQPWKPERVGHRRGNIRLGGCRRPIRVSAPASTPMYDTMATYAAGQVQKLACGGHVCRVLKFAHRRAHSKVIPWRGHAQRRR
jgi:hypothetical protein